MTAYELADYMDNNIDAWHATEQKHLDNAANMLRRQADRIGVLEANHKIQVNINEKALQYITELEKDLHMVQRHYDQLNLPDGYVVVCVHCAKELKIDFDESNHLEAKIAKYEQVLQSIANEQVELSHDKIKWQCEDHIRWAKEALK